MSQAKYLFIVTGSISAYKSLDLISLLKKQGHSIKVVMTKSATKFVSPLTFASISGNQVYTDIWDDKEPMSHIDLIRWADEVIVAPATANYINKIASGVADDLASNLFLAHKFDKPFRLYPAMNTSMLEHPLTQKSLETLSDLGIIIGRTQKGILACGEEGAGKFLEVEKIYQDLFSKKKSYRNLKVLITSGGTKEPIDRVRHIGNISSGATGSAIAEAFVKAGHRVHFLYGEGSRSPRNVLKQEFTSFSDLNEKLEHKLSSESFDYIIHLAAISDYSVQSVETNHGEVLKTNEKLSSSNELVIKLKSNPKIINSLYDYSQNKKLKIIGFKLTDTTDQMKKEEAIAKVFKNKAVKLVIHNELKNITADSHEFEICSQGKKKIVVHTKQELAQALIELTKEEDIKRELTL